jgi:hypothetical protein
MDSNSVTSSSDMLTEILQRISFYEKIIERILKKSSLSAKEEKNLEEAYDMLEVCDIELEALGYFDKLTK